MSPDFIPSSSTSGTLTGHGQCLHVRILGYVYTEREDMRKRYFIISLSMINIKSKLDAL